MDSKAQSILSYLGILWIIAYIFGNQRNRFGLYHLRQGFGLMLFFFPLFFLSWMMNTIFPEAGFYAIFVGLPYLLLSGFGIIHVINRVEKPLPIIGKLFENKFNFIK